MPGSWKRMKLLKQGLNLEKLKQCPGFEMQKRQCSKYRYSTS